MRIAAHRCFRHGLKNFRAIARAIVIGVLSCLWKVLAQNDIHFRNHPSQAVTPRALLRMLIQEMHPCTPLALRNHLRKRTVGNNFDALVRPQEVNQHAIVLRRVPNLHFAKCIPCPFTRTGVALEVCPRQTCFNRNGNFRRVVFFLRFDDVCDAFALRHTQYRLDAP